MTQPRQPYGAPRAGQHAPDALAEATVHDLSPGRNFDWPRTELRRVAWRTNPDQHGPNGRRPNREERELREIEVEVPARIANLPVDLPDSLVERCHIVERDIATLDTEYGGHLSGLTSFLIRSESVATSRIEHLNADMDDFARAILHEEATREAKSMAAAVDAITVLVEDQEVDAPFTEDQLLGAHHALMKDDAVERGYAGRYRDMQNWLGGSDFCPLGAIHVPPPAAEVTPLMADLTQYVNRSDHPPLAQAALAHGQFEAIHPFTDGNGRTGRGLIAAVLRRRSVTSRVTVPVASAMLADVDSYFDALVAYRHGDATTLVEYMLSAADAATREATVSAERLRRMPEQWLNQVRPRRGSSAYKLIEGLLRDPILNAQVAQKITGSSAPRTYEAIDRLADEGVLHEITGHSRNRVWSVSDVATELADLDARIGARTKPSNRWR